jgi:hypothetical protein
VSGGPRARGGAGRKSERRPSKHATQTPDANTGREDGTDRVRPVGNAGERLTKPVDVPARAMVASRAGAELAGLGATD